MEQSAIPDESNTEGKEKKDEQKLGAPEDIFKAKSKLGELKWKTFFASVVIVIIFYIHCHMYL